jgi:hypothetical protein
MLKRSIPVLLVLCAFGVFSASASAETEGPGWELTARTFPTNLGQPVNDVQELTVNATSGEFTLGFQGDETAGISYGAPSATVQAQLEGLASIGGGNIAVSGGAEDYEVTFTGSLGGREEAQLTTDATGLVGGAHAATVTRKTRGGVSGTIAVDVFNVGAAASHGTITVTDTLPEGLTATDAGNTIVLGAGEEPLIGHSLWNCTGNAPGERPRAVGKFQPATVVTCTNNATGLPEFSGGGGLPTFTATEGPNIQPIIAIAVNARPGAKEGAETNHVTIAGGEAPTSASTEDPITINSSSPPFGFVGFDGWVSNADGTLDRQAGSHPYEATFSFDLASVLHSRKSQAEPRAALVSAGGEEVRNIEVELPPGFVGDPTAVPPCPREQFDDGECPNASEIGTVAMWAGVGPALPQFPVYNLEPPPGRPAEFGFSFSGIGTYLDSTVRSGSDYGLTTRINDVAQRQVIGGILTLWGFPGDHTHTIWRAGVVDGGGCSPEELAGTGPEYIEQKCKDVSIPPKSFLTLPTACGPPQPFVIRANTWDDATVKSEKVFLSHDSNDDETGFTGCQHLGFGPQVTTSPDTSDSDTPAGLTVEVRPPLGGLEDLNGFSTADIQNTTVTLPEGLVINPGQAAGLQACQPGQDGLTTEAEKAEGRENDGPPLCPNASKVGTVTIKSPLIEGAPEKQFEGEVYVLQSNPPDLKLLVAASADGVNLKLVGVVHLNEQTGQLTTTFEGTPELPFTVFKLSFSGGAQAALDTPTQCGTYGTTADFTPWSSPFVQDFLTGGSFGITAGPGSGPCPSSPLPFAPLLTAGATTDQAGGFTDFSLLLQRGDGQQRIERLQFKAPAGLSGMLSKVPLCTNVQAEANACPEASKIGHTVVESGPGPYPLVVPEPGQEQAPIYLTEAYGGAPFGLSIVVPLHVGPFTLPTQRVRAKIAVDPHTAQITVTTDPLPQVVAGVPTDLREVDAVIDHPEFMFNPTNCDASSFSGTAWGTSPPGAGGAGATAVISSPFGVGSCRSLEFKPKFSVSTPGKTSKADGAGLTAKVSYPVAAQGTQANITRVKVDLPKQLPSRLTTLQKACTNAQFEANPAGCPAASIIGHAVVHTALLPVPLSGPAYFVSHGGEAFPSLIMVLQGYGVTVDLVGTTFISKAGITSSTFKTVPDVPFTTFELVLPEGKYSALAANGVLCTSKLAMPTEFLAQNGLKINKSTPISVTGCAKKKALTTAQKLATALKTCRKNAKGRRAGCERTARKRYAPAKSKKKTKR